ncbi:MAG: hypothetical protein KDJ16_18060, partial [Hyphomicrobiales bacterium]|nr:hypothetical protein [Hyphomicrobiales bacterium]
CRGVVLMGVKKIVESLRELLESDSDKKKKKRAKEIKKLLDKLEKKEAKLGSKLKDAKSDSNREKIERRLKICKTQRRKGEEALEQLTA